ncbi:DUF2786 domain-containing protein [Pseudomonas qingdaonensis]|uniref:DUF2786 domain-containing protein n=1 Tax=Pseudomonas qingdaonensis TaxID=2056231 RepID=UPI001F25327B|nr:DUF2786 domain-containing protein [Pseudomonas qingdaonensis]
MTEQQHDENKLERVIRKIKRCMALSKSSNENEAATAMRQAQALMREYRLTELDVQLSDVGEAQSSSVRVERRPAWDRDLSATVAGVFGVRALRRWSWCRERSARVERAVFVGVTPAQQIALYAYETLLTKLTSARREYASSVRAGRNRSDYSPETAANHFAIAWVSAVRQKLYALIPRGEDGQADDAASSGTDLVAVEAQDKALIEQYMTGLQVGKARKRQAYELDLDAQIAGLLAGQRVELNPGVATGGEGVALLTSA